jgi:amino acid adenylation domain-containing protein
MIQQEIVDRYPLSALQQGMLLHHLTAPEAGVDIEQILCSLRESIEPARMRQAWQRVVERHPVFRTAFEHRGAEPMQLVYRAVDMPWEEQDWTGYARQDQESRIHELLAQDRRRGFDMTKAPLLRLSVIRLADAEYYLLWTFHHALIDGRSFPGVLNEAFAFYEAGSAEPPALPLPRPYRDYIDWLQTQDLSRGEFYWRTQLKGFSAPTSLVVDKQVAHAALADRQGDERIFLDEETSSALKLLARDNNLTMNTLVQGAWAILLSRYSGSDDVAFGAVHACRKSTFEGADDSIGIFINTLPLRVCVAQDAGVLDWLRQVRNHWMSMRDYEHTPLVQVQKWSEVPAGKPLFESILMFDNYELDERMRAQGGKWARRSFRLYEQTGYPITLTVYAGSSICLQIEFDPARLERATIVRMLHHLKSLLVGMLDSTKRRVADLPLLISEERQQLLVEFNNTDVAYSSHAVVHRLFEDQVKRTPTSIAAACSGKQITYEELNRRANQLAHYLRRCGVGPDVLVGVCVERSVELLVALLGVLKSGGAYVPLDPLFPKERLAQILEDADAPVLVTQSELLSVLPAFSKNTIFIDRPETAAERTENPVGEVGPANLAYTIFTSGSTGRPKGVQIEHQSVVNLLESMGREPGLTSDDVFVAVTTISFDIAGLELFLPLIKGGRVVMATREDAMDGRSLAALLESSGATVMQATPATWRLLLENGWPGRKQMKILCGGEAMPPEIAKELVPRCASLWNVYGPTETTIWSTVWRVSSAEVPVPIGRPIANTQVYVLDRMGQPVPVGVTGELYIAGDGVARGYLNRPELNADRFVHNPFVNGDGRRMYKTGDVARWRPEGILECLGRNDHQVKIRGYRIELGDIEATLSAHADVAQAVVNVLETPAGEKKLVAYIVSANGQFPLAEQLRRFVSGKLPEYMLPVAYVPLQTVPLTPNGKVDRKALPAITDFEVESGRWSAPANEIERKIAAIWSEVLGVSHVGRESNFFEIGGDSLSIIRVRSRLERALGNDVAVVEMFRNPTVRTLAEYLGGGEQETIVMRTREQINAQKELARRRLQRRQLRMN